MATHIDTPPAKAWHQVTDQALNVPMNGSAQMKRVYKLPTSGCNNILNSIPRDSSITYVENWVKTAAGDLDAGLSSTVFQPVTDNRWVLASYYLDQPEAGEYMKLKCLFTYTDIDPDDIPSLSGWEQVTNTVSSVTWQTYSVSPYIYCNEVDHNDVKWYKGDNLSSDTWESMRRHIEVAFTQNAQQTSNHSQLWRNENTTWLLTDAEQAIMKKVAAGVNPVFHKPIVTIKKTVRTTNPHNVPNPPAQVDKVNDPGIVVKDWDGKFIFCGRSWTKTEEKTYYTSSHEEVKVYTLDVVDTWEGALDPDKDFYGDDNGQGAWEFHKGPQRPQQQGQQ